MRAYVLKASGAPLREEWLALHELHGDLVQVRMLASGVCGADLHAVDGEWTTPPPLAAAARR